MISFEETNPCDISLDIVLDILRTHFPDIKEADVAFIYHGTYNVFEVMEDHIFRFPDSSLLNEDGVELIMYENEVLKTLEPHVSLEIPQFDYISEDADLPFCGYRKIPGVSLSTCFDNVTKKESKAIAEQLGVFLSELHSKKVFEEYTEKWPTEFTGEAFREYWRAHYSWVQEQIYPRLDDSQKGWVKTLYSDYLENDENFSFEPKLVHCDFDTSNIIVDPDTFKVNGIIDFEETRVWDLAADLLFFGEGGDFIDEILESYTQPLGRNLIGRMRFLYNRVPLIYISTGISLEYDEMVNAGLEMLVARIAIS
jgi:aminoglycoside phosphotransferase (APT) family kinase protein